MSEHSDKMIADAQAKLREHEQKVIDLKKFINQIREFDGQPPLYADFERSSDALTGPVRSDQFYGQPLATVVRQILVMRKTADLGAATVREIYEKMVEGGFAFEAQNAENAQRALRISLTKNPAFHKLPNGQYGLSEWYPAAKQPRRRPESGHSTTDDAGDSAEAPETPEASEPAETAETSTSLDDLF